VNPRRDLTATQPERAHHDNDELIVGHAVKTGGPAKAAGGEGAGEVAKLGAGVTGFKIDDRVMGRCSGAFAEYSLIDAREALAVPKNLSWEEAACIPLAVAPMAAWRARATRAAAARSSWSERRLPRGVVRRRAPIPV